MFRSGLVNLEKQIIFYSFKNNHDYAIVLVFEQKLFILLVQILFTISSYQ